MKGTGVRGTGLGISSDTVQKRGRGESLKAQLPPLHIGDDNESGSRTSCCVKDTAQGRAPSRRPDWG